MKNGQKWNFGKTKMLVLWGRLAPRSPAHVSYFYCTIGSPFIVSSRNGCRSLVTCTSLIALIISCHVKLASIRYCSLGQTAPTASRSWLASLIRIVRSLLIRSFAYSLHLSLSPSRASVPVTPIRDPCHFSSASNPPSIDERVPE